MTTSGGADPDEPRIEAGGAEDVVPAGLAASWRDAESRLYASLVWDPDVYQRAVLLVGRVVERLRESGPSVAAFRAAVDSMDITVRDAAGPDLPPSLDPGLIARAALAMRLREVVEEQTRRRRLERLAAAARQGAPWVVLEESGEPRGDPARPYRRLEVEVATGRGLYVTAVPDDSFAGVVHEVTAVAVDFAGGGVRTAQASEELLSRHPDAEARECEVSRIKAG